MPKFPLIGPSYTSQSLNADCQSTINLYPESIESGAGNNQIVLYPCPGLKSFVEIDAITPPPPGPAPDIYNTINIPRAGLNSGSNFNLTPFISGPEIQIGDTLFIAFYMLLAGNIHTINAVALNYLASDLGTFIQIGPTLDYGVGPARQALVLFYTTSLVHIPAGGSIGGTFTFTGSAASSDYIIDWTCIRNMTTLDQAAGGTTLAGTSFAAPAITTGEPEFVFSYIYPQSGGLSVSIPSPFFIFTNQLGGEASNYIDLVSHEKIAPAGTYTPTWASNSGSQNAGVITASFKL